MEETPNNPTSQKRLRETYPDRVPVIIKKNKDMKSLEKLKYLVPKDLTVGQFMYIIRKNLNFSQEKALFFFINNTLPPVVATFGEIDLDPANREKDGAVYATITLENTFG